MFESVTGAIHMAWQVELQGRCSGLVTSHRFIEMLHSQQYQPDNVTTVIEGILIACFCAKGPDQHAFSLWRTSNWRFTAWSKCEFLRTGLYSQT